MLNLRGSILCRRLGVLVVRTRRSLADFLSRPPPARWGSSGLVVLRAPPSSLTASSGARQGSEGLAGGSHGYAGWVYRWGGYTGMFARGLVGLFRSLRSVGLVVELPPPYCLECPAWSASAWSAWSSSSRRARPSSTWLQSRSGVLMSWCPSNEALCRVAHEPSTKNPPVLILYCNNYL